ncbi:hematopoietic prostaglandin D synthase-like [Paramacrobiotus metropolitanus]|uniref:hematopoietic prostaglandin D synthase-like n=1 Tax=Paramacrobiotus metropolitanus TaxID=2943436 RepID=UPI0024456471|nr:hematopoietic prostaglandin D synthase-like [Paramacrobiotus metropolitanus]
MAPKYKLVYFDARGRAEPARWVLAYAGVDYEDHRIPKDQWPTLKSTAPFGQVPYLEVDGKPLPQSLSLTRYLARQHKLVGKDDWEAAQADALVDYVQDSLKPLMAIFHEQDEGKKSKLKEAFVKEQIQPYLQGLERKLQENNNGDGFFIGSGPTWADFVVVVALDGILGMESTLLDKFPKLKAHNQRVHELKGIKEWIAKRPNTPM